MKLKYKTTNNRMAHVLGVARKCYEVAFKMGLDEKFCEQMYLIGYLHDIGYDFVDDASNHANAGVELISSLFSVENERFVTAIKKHGSVDLGEVDNLCYLILNYSDMTINSLGESVSMELRLDDIRLRYGEESNVYRDAEKVYSMLKEYF